MLDRLKTFFSALNSSNESVIGVDLGSAYVKVVQLRRKGGKAVLETYGSLALGPYTGVEIGRATRLPPEKLAEAITDVLREAHATAKKAAFAVPFSSSLVATMDMRVLDAKQLPAMVSLEARKYIPVPISEVQLDWWILPEAPEQIFDGPVTGTPARISDEEIRSGKPEQFSETGTRTGRPAAEEYTFKPDENAPRGIKILIAAIHNEALNKYIEVANISGLQASFFEIEIFSTIRALFPQDLAAHAVLDLGAGETKLYVIDRGLIRASHTVSRGGQDLTLALSRAGGLSVEEAEKVKRANGLRQEGREEDMPQTAILNLIFSEADRVLQNFERRFNRKVLDVVFSGGGANLEGISLLAEKDFSVPVRRGNPFAHVEAPAFLEEMLTRVGPEFTVALGIAFRELEENG